jgi:hypothetical protein
VATEHEKWCPREKNTMIKPNDCIYCEVIRNAMHDGYGPWGDETRPE